MASSSACLHPRFVRGLGFAGILGGLTMWAGDMLFYFVPGNGSNLVRNMGVVAAWRHYLSGALSLPSCWLYLAGALQVYLAFQPAHWGAQLTVGLTMGALMSTWALVHANYVAIALTARLAFQHDAADPPLQYIHEAMVSNVWMRNIVLLGIVPPLTVVFLWQVGCGKTHYPRWMCAAFPIWMFLLGGGLMTQLSGDLFQIIAGGFLNIMMVVFFLCSTVALWKARIPLPSWPEDSSNHSVLQDKDQE